MSQDCIFCKIVQGNSDTAIEYENDEIVIFNDIKPASENHFLAVSKVHIDSAKCLKKEDKPLLDNMENSLKELMTSKGLDPNDALFGFHWPPFISVKHLHMHGIAPASKMPTMSKWIFKPGSMWFCTSDYVKKWIK